MAVHIGTSGWSYDHWDGVLYPPGTPPRDRLAHYVQRFGTVELNASFYRWPRDTTFAGWRERLPPGIVLSVKSARGPPGTMTSGRVRRCADYCTLAVATTSFSSCESVVRRW